VACSELLLQSGWQPCKPPKPTGAAPCLWCSWIALLACTKHATGRLPAATDVTHTHAPVCNSQFAPTATVDPWHNLPHACTARLCSAPLTVAVGMGQPTPTTRACAFPNRSEENAYKLAETLTLRTQHIHGAAQSQFYVVVVSNPAKQVRRPMFQVCRWPRLCHHLAPW
jgi:hypothetical protein